MSSQLAGIGAEIRTDIPCRLHRQRWSQFHSLVVVALGSTWILDGLEVTLAGAVAGALIETGSRSNVFAGYLFGATLMICAGMVQAKWVWRLSGGHWKTWPDRSAPVRMSYAA